jgi:hypothetical protein
MLPLSRRLTTALLWLAIALLPIRGLAAAVAPVAMANISSGALSAAADNAAQDPPCHGTTTAATDNDDDATAAPAGSSHNCAMCDLCHISVAQGPILGVSLPTLPAALPRAAAPTPIQPRALDGLYRPPRTLLA